MSYLAFGEMIGLIVMSSIDVEKKNLNKIVFVNLKSLKTHYKYMFHEFCCYWIYLTYIIESIEK